MKHKLVMVMLSVALVVSLVLVGCAKPAPAPGPTPTPTPAPEVLNVKMGLFVAAGDHLAGATNTIKFVEEASGGRIKITLVPEDTVCPVAEHIDATGAGLFDLNWMWVAYYGETYPVLSLFNRPIGLREPGDAWGLDKQGGWDELAQEVWAKWNIHYIGHSPKKSDALVSRVPVPTIEDLKGLKVRSLELNAEAMESLGVSTVFLPPEECYTALSSGLIDATDVYDLVTAYEVGLNEVAKYWVTPPLSAVVQSSFVANMDFWNSLSDADKHLIETSYLYAAQVNGHMLTSQIKSALAEAQAKGVTVTQWSDADQKKWGDALAEVFERYPDDPEWTEAWELLQAYCEKIY